MRLRVLLVPGNGTAAAAQPASRENGTAEAAETYVNGNCIRSCGCSVEEEELCVRRASSSAEKESAFLLFQDNVSLGFHEIEMNFFLPTSRKVLPTFQIFCPVAFHWLGVFCLRTYPRTEVVAAELRTGGILGKMRPHVGKMRPIWAICMKSGQKCSRIGTKKFNHEIKGSQDAQPCLSLTKKGNGTVMLTLGRTVQEPSISQVKWKE